MADRLLSSLLFCPELLEPGKKPQSAVGVDWGSPLTKGLRYCWLAVNGKATPMMSLVNPRDKYGVYNNTWSGNTPKFDGSSSYGQTSQTLDLSGVSQITIAFSMLWDTFADDDDLAMESSANSNSNPGAVLIDPNSGYPASGYFNVNLNCGPGTDNYSYFTRPSAGVFHHYIILLDASVPSVTQACKGIFVDGVSQSLTCPAPNAGPGNFGNFTWYFMSRGGSSLFGAGQMDNICIWTRLLGDAECKTLGRDPFLLYRPAGMAAAKTSSGTTSHTISPSGGMTLGGAATEVAKHKIVPVGGITLAGAAVQLVKHKIIPAGGATLGGSATWVQKQKVVPAGGLSLGGGAAWVQKDLIAPSGGVTLGGAASWQQTGGHRISPSGGLALAGAAGMRAVRKFVPSGGVVLGGAAQWQQNGPAGPASSELVVDGPRNVVLHYATTANSSQLLILDPATLSFIDPARGKLATGLRVDRIQFQVSDGAAMTLLWDATTPIRICELVGRGDIQAQDRGGLINNAGAGRTGKILLSVSGAGFVAFTLWAVKQ